MSDNQVKFQNLLRELFQFDCADLDFGIYRIMNYKRAVIERFITEDLPQAIAEELEQGALAEQTKVQEALASARQKVLEALGDDALDVEGNLAEKYRQTRAGKEYLEAQQRAKGSRSREALEAAVYNHLYAFFSRYWQDGDFISKRRYSKLERYAIPYNGEEVYLYWANHDQYYVKTGEYFTDYTYKAPNGVTVHFKLRQADVEQNNVKGEKRFFLPCLDEIAWDGSPLPTGEGMGVRGQLIIPFEYRPLTAQEAITYSQKNTQEAILAKAVAEIPQRLKATDALAALAAERRKTADGTVVSYLEHHLRQYTRRNTSDFFIHKDLKGFLSRELDFYLKNEVLNLEELEAAGEELAEGWFQLLRLIKRIGLRIIEFLAQIEDFQKMLWEKKKFVTETFYIITVGNIPEAFYAEIAACEAQWEEWLELGMLNAECGKMNTQERSSFLTQHLSLPVDTRHFPQDFTDRLLASFENLDEMIDGLLVHAENWQALNLLQEKYRERVKCIYIDPPFNTGGDFLYKDNFRNSSWIALLYDRLRLSLKLFLPEGNYFIHLDHNAVHYGKLLLVDTFSELNEIIFNTNATKDEESGLFSYKSFGQKFVRQHDTILHGYNSTINFVKLWKPNRNTSQLDLGQLDLISRSKVDIPKRLDDFAFYVERYRDGILVEHKINVGEEKIFPIGDIWNDLYSFTQSEMRVSENLSFLTQKPENLVRRILQTSTVPGDLVLDFFAGSGTTATVSHKLCRKYIAVEMGDCFETVYENYDSISSVWVERLGILGRMKNVLHGDIAFKACGKDRRSTLSKQIGWGGGGIVKCIRLESYEDALNNLTFDEQGGKQALDLFKDDYLLSYMLRWETRHSETLLNVEKLQLPFSYKLHLHRDGETCERLVDLPETFNYLLGLDVQTRRVLPSPRGRGDGGEVRYLVYRGALRNGRAVAVIWRNTQGWTQEDYQHDAAFVAEHNLTAGADEIYVNGDSRIPGARSLDPLFKERMFATVES